MEEVFHLCSTEAKAVTIVILQRMVPFFAYLFVITCYVHYSTWDTIWMTYVTQLWAVYTESHDMLCFIERWFTHALPLCVHYQLKTLRAVWEEYKRVWFFLFLLWFFALVSVVCSKEFGEYIVCYCYF
jgi:hypothetical protein